MKQFLIFFKKENIVGILNYKPVRLSIMLFSFVRFLEGINEQIGLHVLRKEDSSNHELVQLHQGQVISD